MKDYASDAFREMVQVFQEENLKKKIIIVIAVDHTESTRRLRAVLLACSFDVFLLQKSRYRIGIV